MSIRAAASRQASHLAANPAANKVSKVPERRPPAADERWSFSFRYFSEIEYFGLDSAKIDKKWMLSVIYRLQELSKLTISQVMEERNVVGGTMRIHNIDWGGRSVPIKLADLDWIDKDYLGNPQEYPIMQIAVSKAEGRLVGFFDEQNAFQIVLLDPLHNAQPSRRNGYKVQLCSPLGCEMTAVRHEVHMAIERISARDCSCADDLKGALDWKRRKSGTAMVIPASDGKIVADADALIEMGWAEGYEGIVAAGIEKLLGVNGTGAKSGEAA